MSVLSANTLFHFTSKEALLNILGTGFRPTYCKEFGPESIDGALHEMFIPMVCFCDLPMSKLQKHINGYSWEFNEKIHKSKIYGCYGLGMSKEWGRRYKLNPVTYVTPESYYLQFVGQSVNFLFELYEEYKLLWQNDPTDPRIKQYFDDPVTRMRSIGSPPMPLNFRTFDQLQIALSNMVAALGYLKPYQDSTTGQIYYDEREWRYVVPYPRGYQGDVPPLRLIGEKHVPLIDYRKDREYNIETYKKNILERYMVGFHPEDIKYIILKEDNDVNDFINRLKEMPEIYTSEKIDRLTTRIITNEQLKQDF